MPLIDKSASRDILRSNLALKLGKHGKYIASVPGEKLSVDNRRLFLQSTEPRGERVEIPWPSQLPRRNIYLTEPISISTNGAFIMWDHAIFCLRTHALVAALPLQAGEKVCRVGGLSHDSSIAVYGVDRR